MDISIAAKLKPFSTQLGPSTLIPGTSLRTTIYPTRIALDDLSGSKPTCVGTVQLPLAGPSKPTVQLDLEKGLVRVWGNSAAGYYRYHLTAFGPAPLTLVLERGSLQFESEDMSLQRIADNRWSIEQLPLTRITPPHLERLSLGSHRKQDWPQILRRGDMGEVFPIWLQLAQWCPPQEPATSEGTATLLSACCKAITQCDRTKLLAPFEHLLSAGFEGILSPTLEDKFHQGYRLNPLTDNSQANPIAMLVEGALLIRSLFIQRYDEEIRILPALPVEFHAGRALNLGVKGKGYLNIEWSKKEIRRVVFHSTFTGDLNLTFPKSISGFRLRTPEKQSRLNRDLPIPVTEGQSVWLDCFQK